MKSTADYSMEWLEQLTDSELQHWILKPQAEKDWWAFNTDAKDRASLLRTEIEVEATYQSLLDLPVQDHQRILDHVKRAADEARERLEKFIKR